jgi:hypothetical protein
VFWLGGLLTFFALWAIAYAVALSSTNGKDNRMETENTMTEKLKLASIALGNTILAIGTSAWTGLALSG